MQRYVAPEGQVLADKVISCRGDGIDHWVLVTASGDFVRVSHDQVAELGVKCGDFLIYSRECGLLGSMKPALFNRLFRLSQAAAA